MDLYNILPKNIKQVFSAFADHDPLLLSALTQSYKILYGGRIWHNNDIMHSL